MQIGARIGEARRLAHAAPDALHDAYGRGTVLQHPRKQCALVVAQPSPLIGDTRRLKQRGNSANAKAKAAEAKPSAKAEPVAKPVAAKPAKPVDSATKKRHAAVEAKLASLAAEAEVLDAELATASAKGGAQAAQALAALGQRRNALQAERESLELEWLDLAERIEAG